MLCNILSLLQQNFANIDPSSINQSQHRNPCVFFDTTNRKSTIFVKQKTTMRRNSIALLLLFQAASAFTVPGSSHTRTSAIIRSGPLYSEAVPSDAVADDSQADNGDDLFPSDPAKTTPQFLSALWHLIAKGNTMVRGVSCIRPFPFAPLRSFLCMPLIRIHCSYLFLSQPIGI